MSPPTMTNAARISMPRPTTLSQWPTTSSRTKSVAASRMCWPRCHLQIEGECSSYEQREADPDDAGRPAEAIEDLAQHRTADESAQEVGSEIDATRRAAVSRGCPANEAGRGRLGEERTDAQQNQADKHSWQIRPDEQRQANASRGKSGP